MGFNIKEKYNEIKENFEETLRETAIEAVIGAVVGTLIAFPITNHFESKRANKIPLAFSEITQIENDAKYSGKQVGNITRYLTGVNDASMKVFECWNLAHKQYSDLNEQFATELELQTDPAYKYHHYSLAGHLKSLPENAEKAKQQLSDFVNVMSKLPTINNHFSNSWTDMHIDNYHTETDTDEDGDTTTSEVYDDTTHHYTYSKGEGEAASQSLDNLLGEQKTLDIKEEIKTASQTNAEGEYAADSTMEHKDGKQTLGILQYREIASIWKKGSTLLAKMPTIQNLWRKLPSDANDWRSAKNTAHNAVYTTGSRYDAGPKEFQIAERTLSHGKDLHSAIYDVISGIEYAKQNAPVLDRKIQEFIHVCLDHKKGNAGKLRNEIIHTAQEMYSLNFKNGLDVKQYRIWMLLLGLLGGAAAGGAIGFGIDKLAERKNWWDTESHKMRNRF